ncbi:DUF5937 family protein [Brevibacillus humidisoli]|uniref:DUF5937 family protein n=1 Tax=Brevibacillus humidisoli TaxID=2895522 RepID=UPI001E56EF11|nr:DUF5937 family protein [Brevibacillus humidisoli]UFJ42271.1 DUF5937 family protein [Brevibacillus humidisoli]
MIKIDLSKLYNPNPPIRFSVSPLFEMAASLHTLTQVLPTLQHHQWVKKSVEILKGEGLYSEWVYFSPLFAYSVPSLFAVHRTELLTTEEEQFTYLAELPLDQFIHSLNETLCSSMGRSQPHLSSLPNDLQGEPELIRGRFNLFFAAYTHYIFREKWDELQPTVVRERTRFENLRSTKAICDYLQEIVPLPIQHDSSERLICLPLTTNHQDTQEVVRIALHPSWFLSHPPRYTQFGDTLHIAYSLISQPIS